MVTIMRNDNHKVWQALTMILQFGLNMLVPIGLCTFFGIWLGEKTGVSWLVVPLFFVGALSGFTSIYKMAKSFMKDDSSRGRRDSQDVKKIK